MRQLRNFGSGGGEPRELPPEAKKYMGMSGSELMSELKRSVTAAKADGTFSPEKLDEFAAFVMPSLDISQRERLSELIKLIKDADYL